MNSLLGLKDCGLRKFTIKKKTWIFSLEAIGLPPSQPGGESMNRFLNTGPTARDRANDRVYLSYSIVVEIGNFECLTKNTIFELEITVLK